jgi:hypothetical protein
VTLVGAPGLPEVEATDYWEYAAEGCPGTHAYELLATLATLDTLGACGLSLFPKSLI